LRKFAGFATLFAIALLASRASAQQGDVALGFSALMSPGAASCSFATGLCPEKGGVYPSINADVIFHRRIGFNYEVTWRGGQGLYGGCANCQPYRPIINDFSAIFQPRLGKKLGADLLAGIGFQDTRYYGYQPTYSCYALGACFTSSFHFLTDIGGGIRYYFWHSAFIRPEVRYYYVHNNTADFSSGNLLRVGASLGYTIGGR
jgi:hypothetical protein